jgi:hypothetical protein
MAGVEHTPLPWVVSDDEIETEGGQYVCHFGYGSEADAEFIVRACNAHYELLAAAKLALSTAESWIDDLLDGTSMVDGALAELEPVRAALAKAEQR